MMSDTKMIHFEKAKAKDANTTVDHEVQYIPASIGHDGSEEVWAYGS